MMNTIKKIRILNEIVEKMEWVKSRTWNDEKNEYEDDPGREEENEYVEKLEKIFIEAATKEMNNNK